MVTPTVVAPPALPVVVPPTWYEVLELPADAPVTTIRRRVRGMLAALSRVKDATPEQRHEVSLRIAVAAHQAQHQPTKRTSHKPCPFCGLPPYAGPVRAARPGNRVPWEGRFEVSCEFPQCFIGPSTAPERTQEEADAAWNVRLSMC